MAKTKLKTMNLAVDTHAAITRLAGRAGVSRHALVRYLVARHGLEAIHELAGLPNGSGYTRILLSSPLLDLAPLMAELDQADGAGRQMELLPPMPGVPPLTPADGAGSVAGTDNLEVRNE